MNSFMLKTVKATRSVEKETTYKQQASVFFLLSAQLKSGS